MCPYKRLVSEVDGLSFSAEADCCAMQKSSAQDKARSKTAVLAAGVQEDLAKMREKLTVKDVSADISQRRQCGAKTCPFSWALASDGTIRQSDCTLHGKQRVRPKQ